ncbi:MAG: 5'-nucleotidase, partial [Oscillospiraceae bacterium]|nr:5'-nucleotidase [Oscillospiraceae bacterium]
MNEGGGRQPVEVLIASRNSADTGYRVFNSIEHYGLDISRGLFTSGMGLAAYLKAFDIDLFLTANPADAQAAIDCGIPAATIVSNPDKEYDCTGPLSEIRIAFDGDAVLFSDESEVVFKQEGLEAFTRRENELAAQPMAEGPMAKFLRALNRLQQDDSTLVVRLPSGGSYS